VPDNPRIEDLRRRIEKDPASVAFAQLGEEYRRAGRFHEAVETCRNGLARHPAYPSARVTLGRALVELGDLDQAEHELDLVLRAAPDNLAAVRGLAEIQHRRGNLDDALARYQAALDLVRHDPELEEIVKELKSQLARTRRPEAVLPAQGAPAAADPPPTAPPAAVLLPKPTRVIDPSLHVLPVLERWLDRILNDRQERALGTWRVRSPL
jgi:tetratricopeptide (TPR) repeat protein